MTYTERTIEANRVFKEWYDAEIEKRGGYAAAEDFRNSVSEQKRIHGADVIFRGQRNDGKFYPFG